MSFFDAMDLENFNPEGALESAIEQKAYAKAYALLRRRKKPLEGSWAGRCLAAALQCTEKLFRAVLDNCEPGIYAGTLNWRNSYSKQTVQATGTILLLAAALDKPKHAEILLREYGYDCNSASLEDSQVLQEHSDFRVSRPRNARKSGAEGSCIAFWRDGQETWSSLNAWRINCCTPLAAAVACGAMATTALLLKQSGIWKEESSAVCRASVMALDGNWMQKDCAIQVFPLEGNAYLFQDKKDVFENWNLQPGSFVDFCRVEDLRAQLKSGLCTREDIRDVLWVLSNDSLERVRCPGSKLLALIKYDPELGRERETQDLILRSFSAAWVEDRKPDMRLLACWRKLTGPVADISGMRSQLLRIPAKKLRELLLLLKEGKQELVVDADVLRIGYPYKFSGLSQLLRHVTVRPGEVREGISGFAACLLSSGNLKLARQAVQLGLLQREPKEEMLAYIKERGNNPALKPLVLAMPRGEKREDKWAPNPQEGPRWYWSSAWSGMSEEQVVRWRGELWEKPVSKETCLRRLLQMRDDANFNESLGWRLNFDDWDDRVVLEHSKLGEVTVDGVLGAAVVGNNPALLEALLDIHPEHLSKRVEVQFSGKWCRQMEATPLCLAAAMGRTEQMRVLLERGAVVNELESSCRSKMQLKRVGNEEAEEYSFFPLSGYRQQVVTPLLAAILMGEEETARLLLEHGAECDISRSYAWSLLECSTPKALALAERLPGIGYERVSAERVEALRAEFRAQGAEAAA